MREPTGLDNPLDDPFADQLEWLRHRYDPGHSLGGTLRPELRLTLGARAKRFAALLAFSGALGALSLLVFSMVAMRAFMPDPYTLASGTLSLLVGVKMWRLADLADRRRRVEPGESSTLWRLAWLPPLATGVAVLGLRRPGAWWHSRSSSDSWACRRPGRSRCGDHHRRRGKDAA